MEEPQALVAAMNESRRRLAHLTADLESIFEFQQSSPPDDEHDIEGSSVGFERARVTALLDAERAHLAQLEQARTRLGSVGYGSCERCHGEIGAERLEALPATTTCVGCASAGDPLHPGVDPG